MRHVRGSVWWGWIFVLAGIPPLWGRDLPAGDSVRPCLCLRDGTDSSHRLQLFSEYQLHASLFSGSDPGNPARQGNLMFWHSLRCQWRTGGGQSLLFTGSFLHRLGLQYFFDGLFRVSADENTLRIHAERPLAGFAGVGLDSDISTALLSNYNLIRTDSGRVQNVLRSAFLTPMTWNLSVGLNLAFGTTVSMLLGISGARLTVVRNAGVYKGLTAPVFYGVPAGRQARLEYGLTLKFLMDKTFRGIFRWNTDLLLFKSFALPWDLNLKNSVEFKVSRYVLFSVQTKIIYDCDISRRVQWENLFSGGFSVRF